MCPSIRSKLLFVKCISHKDKNVIICFIHLFQNNKTPFTFNSGNFLILVEN